MQDTKLYETIENEVVLDKWGNVDIAYYENKASEMRSEYLTELFATLRTRLSNGLRHLTSAPGHARSA